MDQIAQEARHEIAAIIAAAGKLPLHDAADDLLKYMPRLDSLEGRRPTPEQVRINRTLSPEQWHAKYRYEREHTHEGPMFGNLKRAKPDADDADLRHAIIEAVKFYDACEKYFKWEGDFWDCVAHAVAKAQREYPHYLDKTYRNARNHLAYLMQ
jgi:hypothetical protein